MVQEALGLGRIGEPEAPGDEDRAAGPVRGSGSSALPPAEPGHGHQIAQLGPRQQGPRVHPVLEIGVGQDPGEVGEEDRPGDEGRPEIETGQGGGDQVFRPQQGTDPPGDQEVMHRRHDQAEREDRLDGRGQPAADPRHQEGKPGPRASLAGGAPQGDQRQEGHDRELLPLPEGVQPRDQLEDRRGGDETRHVPGPARRLQDMGRRRQAPGQEGQGQQVLHQLRPQARGPGDQARGQVQDHGQGRIGLENVHIEPLARQHRLGKRQAPTGIGIGGPQDEGGQGQRPQGGKQAPRRPFHRPAERRRPRRTPVRCKLQGQAVGLRRGLRTMMPGSGEFFPKGPDGLTAAPATASGWRRTGRPTARGQHVPDRRNRGGGNQVRLRGGQ